MRRNLNQRPVRAARRRLPAQRMPSAPWPKLSSVPYRVIRLMGQLRYARYMVASAMALAADLSIFFVLLHVHMPAVEASICGYASGLNVQWLLTSRLVFADRMQPVGAARMHQQLLFVLSALLGLLITAAVIKGGIEIGVSPGLSKLAAVAVSFHVTYILRRTFIFA